MRTNRLGRIHTPISSSFYTNISLRWGPSTESAGPLHQHKSVFFTTGKREQGAFLALKHAGEKHASMLLHIAKEKSKTSAFSRVRVLVHGTREDGYFCPLGREQKNWFDFLIQRAKALSLRKTQKKAICLSNVIE